MNVKNHNQNGKLRRWISPLNIFVLFVMGWACSCLGQASQIKETGDNQNWSRLFQPGISNDGEWINYTLLFDTIADTLIVANTNTKKLYGYALGSYGQFNEQSTRFAFLHPEKGVGVLNLNNGGTKWFKGGNFYKLAQDGKSIAISITKSGEMGKQGILFLRFEDNKAVFLAKSREPVFSEDGLYLAVCKEDSGVTVIQTQDLRQTQIAKKNKSNFPIWSPIGHQLAFLVESQKFFNIQIWNPKNPQIIKELTNQRVIKTGIPIAKQPIFFSDDGNNLFFYRESKKNSSSKTDINVEIWKGNDKWLYPRNKLDYNPADQGLLTAWSSQTDSLCLLATKEHPATILSGNQEFAMNYNILDYTPEYTQFPYADIYCTNLKNGKQVKAITKQYLAYNYNKLSPGGRYWASFREGHWWVYDMQLNTLTNVTKQLPVGIVDTEDDYAGPKASYGCPGWTEDDNALIVYSRYDIWEVKHDGKGFQRLTNGQKNQVTYRLYNNFSSAYPHHRYPHFEGGKFNISLPVLLNSTTKDGLTDFYRWLPEGKTEKITSETLYSSNLKKASHKESYLYTEESYNLPARLMVRKRNEDPKIKYQTNTFALNVNSQTCERISYTDSKGNQLGGILYYPSHYNPRKKYPMIVSIYERQSDKFYQYIVPTDYPGDGFNLKTYTNAGYMVLLPDIAYTIGMPGPSALDCVTKAVNTVLEKKLVYPEHIGLIGHSYGGFETAFIVSQTSLFKAAVAGSSITDLTSYYHSIYGNSGTSQQWRYENQQFRMGIPYFKDKDAYLRNSPINYANKIKTPLLLWSGKEDENVSSTQSVELYLALRRQEQPVTMLLYPEESHTLLKQENQKDLSVRIEQWFNSYLK